MAPSLFTFTLARNHDPFENVKDTAAVTHTGTGRTELNCQEQGSILLPPPLFHPHSHSYSSFLLRMIPNTVFFAFIQINPSLQDQKFIP